MEPSGRIIRKRMNITAWCSFCPFGSMHVGQSSSFISTRNDFHLGKNKDCKLIRHQSVRCSIANDDIQERESGDLLGDHAASGRTVNGVPDNASNDDQRENGEVFKFEEQVVHSEDYYSLGGLMKDSILELKWKAEGMNGNVVSDVANATAPVQCVARDRIVPVADPARLFKFTRIAAPTALLGGPEILQTTSSSLKNVEPPVDVRIRGNPDVLPHVNGKDQETLGKSQLMDDNRDVAALPSTDDNETEPLDMIRRKEILQRQESKLDIAMPYSAASLVQRMYRYMRAQRNRSEFLSLFQGEFDNFDQIASQRAADIYPREGGGHEHIHCSLTVLNDDTLFARYYFNGNPSIVFRSRLYRVNAMDTSERGLLEMRIFRFYEETEQKLKACNYDISAIEWSDDDIYDWLEGCEVFWERYEPPENGDDSGARELGIRGGLRYVGYMEGGGCELFSREINGRIRVMDDLLLTKDDLWVSDRGFDESGNFIYGNRKGEPYKMKRVDPKGSVAWTLSSSASAPEGYKP